MEGWDTLLGRKEGWEEEKEMKAFRLGVLEAPAVSSDHRAATTTSLSLSLLFLSSLSLSLSLSPMLSFHKYLSGSSV